MISIDALARIFFVIILWFGSDVQKNAISVEREKKDC